MKKKEKILIALSIILFISFIASTYYFIQINSINKIILFFPILLASLSILMDINYREKNINWTKKEKKIYYIIVIVIIVTCFIFFPFEHKENVYLLGYSLNDSEFMNMYTSIFLLISTLLPAIYFSFIIPHNRKKNK
jgi:peptidoglycan/LPS O-acetylase OafA/YrhL